MSSAAAESGHGPPEIRQPEEPISTDDIGKLEFTGRFFQEIGRRKRKGRDAKILVTARDAQTGIGKSNLSDFLGYTLDTSSAGFQPHKCCGYPEPFFDSYGRVERESALILEEGEQLDSRRFMSEENVKGSQTWMMDRVREIVAIINLPSPAFIDKRFEKLADYWINVERRGYATVYKKKIHDTRQDIWYLPLQGIEWPNMDGSATLEYMNSLKDERIDDERDDWVSPSDHKEAVEKARKNTRRETRDKILSTVYNETALAAGDIANCSDIEIKASRIRQIANDTS